VVRNDALTVDAVMAKRPDRIVISPGPGRPEDAGVSCALIERNDSVPLLGVCLGHQALAVAFGGRVDRASAPMHGKISLVTHEGSHLFAGLTGPIEAGRYHSLVIARDAVPADFVVSAWVAEDQTIMGVRHRTHPVFGVSFIPSRSSTGRPPRPAEFSREPCSLIWRRCVVTRTCRATRPRRRWARSWMGWPSPRTSPRC
jgi:anthranilate synthase/aminodeoxychorismate synthase-like glutamine amidotransferase